MTATQGSSGRGGRRAGAGRKRKDAAKPPKGPPKQRGGSGRGGWRPGAGRKPGSTTRAAPSRPPPGQFELPLEGPASEEPRASVIARPQGAASAASATEAAAIEAASSRRAIDRKI